MTEQTQKKPFVVKILPHGKPILMQFAQVPQPKEKTFSGTKEMRVNLMLKVADTEYPEFRGYPVFTDFNPWINNYNGKATKLYKLLCEMIGEPLPEDWLQVDALNLLEDDWRHFFGHYVVRMTAPQPGKKDPNKLFQDIDVILNPAGVGFPVDARKIDLTQRAPLGLPTRATSAPPEGQQTQQAATPKEDKPAGPLGLPKGNQPPAKTAEPHVPPKDEPKAPEPPPLKRTFGTKADMVGELKVMVKAHADFVKLKDDFLALKGAPLVTNLSEDAVKHLLVLFWLEEHRMNGGVVSAQIGAELMTKHKALHQLTDAEAIFLLAASDHEAALDKNF